MDGGVFIAVAVGLVVLAITFALVGWAQKEDQGQKGQGQKAQGQKGQGQKGQGQKGQGQKGQGQKNY
jgi:hypothetical protein